MTGHRLVCAAALVLALVACSDSKDDPKEGCKTAKDCESGQICVDGECRPGGAEACDPACEAPTPVCDQVTATCKTCTDDDGCSGAKSVCLTEANEGKGECVACLVSDDCQRPQVCDTATHTCVACTETEGCFGSKPLCVDGQCVACTATQGCEAPQFCDLSAAGGKCVTCTADGTGCEEDLVCDTSVAGGKCVTCTAAAGCEAPQICDNSVVGGRCVNCTAFAGCEAPTFCDVSKPDGECVICTADGTGCAQGEVCDTRVPGGKCGHCLVDGDCEDGEFCDQATLACVYCNAAHDGCDEAALPYCDTTAHGGKGECFSCVADEHCTTERPICHPTMHFCAECLGNADCPAARPFCQTYTGTCAGCRNNDDCDEDQVCQSGACASRVSAQIQAVRTAPVSSSLDLPINEALVTYLRPAVEGEPAGFFVQGEPTGPAVFVAVAPVSLDPPARVGSQVSFRVTEKAVDESGAVKVVSIEGWSVKAEDQPLDTFVQNLSGLSRADLVDHLGDYESELISVAGTIGQVAAPADGFVILQFATTGMPTANADVVIRIPALLANDLDLAQGCTFELAKGVMWRQEAVAQLAGYREADFTNIACP
jgi:hypothetical protein